jgi:hypothetical protein
MRSRVPERRRLRITKTALNPRIKLTVTEINRGLGLGAVNESPGFPPEGTTAPPKKQSQEGIRGSTQGDKNESSPAAKAKKSDRFSVI